MREEGLTGEARRQDVGVALRVLFPGAHRLELEHAAANVRVQHPVLEPLDRRQPGGVDFVEATQVAGQRVRLAFDRMGAEVLEQVVVRMHAVERGVRRMRFAKIAEQIVDEVWERFGSNHVSG